MEAVRREAIVHRPKDMTKLRKELEDMGEDEDFDYEYEDVDEDEDDDFDYEYEEEDWEDEPQK